MSLLQRNVLANFVGKGWAAVLGLAVVPLYIRILGIEAYGLIGFYITLQAVFAVLDLGLSTTLNRELARFSALPDRAQDMRNLVRTLEVIYWGVALFIGGLVMALSPFIARYWVQAETIPVSTVQLAVMLMGLVLAFQWPFGFYSGGLLGLQYQVLYNVLLVIMYTLRYAGVLLVLYFVSPTIEGYFLWQAGVSIFVTILTAITLWRVLPRTTHQPIFQRSLLSEVWRFAAGLSGISLTVLVLTQADKVILSRILPLAQFGYYTLAWLVANSLYLLVIPFFMALFPRFTDLVGTQNTEQLADLYHSSSQIVAVLVFPISLGIAFFSKEILLFWTGDPVTVSNTYLLVTLLILGTALHGMMNLPFALQLAYGWTKLALFTNLIAIAVLLPALLILTSFWGTIGAAFIWLALNLGWFLLQIPVMHSRLLVDEKSTWYRVDLARPFLASLIVIVPGRWFVSHEVSSLAQLLSIGGVVCIAAIAAAIFTPVTQVFLTKLTMLIYRRLVPA